MARIRKDRITKVGTTSIPLWRIAVYIRLSREDGDDESLSVTNQKKILAEYVEQSLDGPHTLAGFYIDDGNTGTDHDRPAFQRMLGDIEDGQVNCVICKTLSRAFRNYADQGYFLEDFFPRHHTRFISVGGPHVDSFANPEAISGLEVPITGLMNDRFASKTSEDVRRTFNTKRRNGEYIGAFAPYGYSKDPNDKNRLIVDDEAAQVVRDVFAWFVLEGLSLTGICHWLNERGFPNPSAYKRKKGLNYHNPKSAANDGLWNASTLRRLLKNEIYLGHMVQGRQKVVSYKVHDLVNVPPEQWFIKRDTHEPVVDEALFGQAQALLARDTRTANGHGTVSLFAGFLCCADCQKAMHRHPAKRFVYYVCRTYAEKSPERCTRHSIREDTLEEAVLAAIRAQLLLMDGLVEALADANPAPVTGSKLSRVDALLAARGQETEHLRNAIADLYLDWKSGGITKDEYDHIKQRFDAQLRQLAQIIDTLEAEKKRLADAMHTDIPAVIDAAAQGTLDRLDRGLLTALLDAARIHEGQRITLCLRCGDSYGGSQSANLWE